MNKKEYYKEYRIKNSERIKQYNRKYYADNKEKIKEQRKKYVKEHEEEVKESRRKANKRYKEKHKEEIKERARLYQQNLSEEQRANLAYNRRIKNQNSIDNAINHYTKWTKEETQYLIDNYENMTIYEIAADLGRSINAVERKRNKLKLYKDTIKSDYENEII